MQEILFLLGFGFFEVSVGYRYFVFFVGEVNLEIVFKIGFESFKKFVWNEQLSLNVAVNVFTFEVCFF